MASAARAPSADSARSGSGPRGEDERARLPSSWSSATGVSWGSLSWRGRARRGPVLGWRPAGRPRHSLERPRRSSGRASRQRAQSQPPRIPIIIGIIRQCHPPSLNPRVTQAALSGFRCGRIRVKPSRPPEDAGCGPHDPLGGAAAGDGPWAGVRSRWRMPKPLTRTAARVIGWRLASHGAIGRRRDSNRVGRNSGDRETRAGWLGSLTCLPV